MNEKEYILRAKQIYGGLFEQGLADPALVGVILAEMRKDERIADIKKEMGIGGGGGLPTEPTRAEPQRKRPMTEKQRRYLSVNGITAGTDWGFDEASAAIDKHKRGGS